jgi:HlyD family secretion protein
MTGTEILKVANLNNMEMQVDVENDIVKVKWVMMLMLKLMPHLKNNLRAVTLVFSNSAGSALTADQVTI